MGLRAGLAWFDGGGRLLRARSTHFATKSVLRRAIPGILREVPGLAGLVLEGGGELAEIWRKAAARHRLPVWLVTAEEWRKEVLLPSQQGNGQLAKRLCVRQAAAIARENGCSPVAELVSDVAEAIVFGRWFLSRLRHHSKESPLSENNSIAEPLG